MYTHNTNKVLFQQKLKPSIFAYINNVPPASKPLELDELIEKAKRRGFLTRPQEYRVINYIVSKHINERHIILDDEDVQILLNHPYLENAIYNSLSIPADSYSIF